jgi:hypothetical protein
MAKAAPTQNTSAVDRHGWRADQVVIRETLTDARMTRIAEAKAA